MEHSKACSKCGQTKTINDFYKEPRSKDGFVSKCKACSNEISRIYKLRNREKLREYQKRRYQRDSKKIKAYQKTRYANDVTFRENQNKAYKKWVIENREQDNTRKRLWAQNNPQARQAKDAARRQRQNNAKSFVVFASEITKLRSGSCFYCGLQEGLMTIDHIVPLARGGSHSIGNLVGACKSCNSSKGAKTITEWQKVRRSL